VERIFFFLEKRGKQAAETKKNREKAKTDVGRKNRDYGLYTEKKKNRPHPLGHHHCFFFSTATSSTGSNRQQNQGKREWDWCWREKKGEKNRIQGMKKKQIIERRTVTSLSGASLFVV
jgi:hypothetical protein